MTTWCVKGFKRVSCCVYVVKKINEKLIHHIFASVPLLIYPLDRNQVYNVIPAVLRESVHWGRFIFRRKILFGHQGAAFRFLSHA